MNQLKKPFKPLRKKFKPFLSTPVRKCKHSLNYHRDRRRSLHVPSLGINTSKYMHSLKFTKFETARLTPTQYCLLDFWLEYSEFDICWLSYRFSNICKSYQCLLYISDFTQMIEDVFALYDVFLKFPKVPSSILH